MGQKQEQKMSLRRRQYLAEGDYYSLKSGMKIKEIAKRWQDSWEKAYDDSMPVLFPAKEVWPYREYTWTRVSSRPGFACVKNKSVQLSGELKWDAIKEDMQKYGWNKREPLILNIGQKGGIKVGEGNHRLAIARELSIKSIPVTVIFQAGNVVKSKQPRKSTVSITSQAVKKVTNQYSKSSKKISKKEQKQIDDIIDLLFTR